MLQVPFLLSTKLNCSQEGSVKSMFPHLSDEKVLLEPQKTNGSDTCSVIGAYGSGGSWMYYFIESPSLEKQS